jgi:hypothetical protein
MASKSKEKYTGLGVGLGALLGAVFGVWLGHIGVWLGLGFGLGILLGTALHRQRPACPQCSEIHRMHQGRVENP